MHLQRTSTLTGERVRNSCERKYINMPIFSASHRHAHSINVLFVRSVLLLRFTKRRFQYYYYYYYVDLNWDGREGAGHCCSILDVVGISFLIMHRVDAICMCFSVLKTMNSIYAWRIIFHNIFLEHKSRQTIHRWSSSQYNFHLARIFCLQNGGGTLIHALSEGI